MATEPFLICNTLVYTPKNTGDHYVFCIIYYVLFYSIIYYCIISYHIISNIISNLFQLQYI